MVERYTVRLTVLESGERLPLLVDVRSGVPLFDPTVFVLSELRARNRASATIEQALRAIKVFEIFCDLYEINLVARISKGRLLSLGEINALAQLCRLPMAAIEALSDLRPVGEGHISTSFESVRFRSWSGHHEVAGDSCGIRIRYIRQFIGWLADRYLLSMNAKHALRATLFVAKDRVESGLTGRIPARGRTGASNRSRRALNDSMQERLWQVVHANSLENPWHGAHSRVRNELIIRWFMGLGVRRGELLGIKISDIDFQSNTVFIARRADDFRDPRVRQPNAKTRDRLLPISDDLARRTRLYILNERRVFPAARGHAFLLVANGGAPLSLRGLNRIFASLGKRHSELRDVFPHILRHTNNYNFSKIADAMGMEPEMERKTRSQLMGWSETSGSAEVYTRRETERKARTASLLLQRKMVRPCHEDKA
ncbi:integrase [Pandoraea horticolens]|uniref:Integrase n=1 Tax=Pandoraea horticolens TaxID=2508298 RepID=A0A5E4R9N0_9BURK|nr:integrase [Pandoraea horticolens]